MLKKSSMSILMLLTALLSKGEKALACSSCGSGGADPVVLNPYEDQKLYLGLGLQGDFRDIDQHGNARSSYGPEARQTLDLAFAQRLTQRAFVSAVAQFGRNSYEGRSVMQNGDASLNARFNAVQQNIAEPWIPQLQLIFSHRFALGRSIFDQRSEQALDVFGAGYDETYVGADLWYGMNRVMFGGSFLIGRPDSASSAAGTVKPGPMQRAIATIGGMPWDEAKLIGGAIQERREGFSLDGEAQPQSDRRTHDLFLTLETLHPEGANYRVTLTRKAAWGTNRNAVEASALTFAWMRAL